MTRPLFTVRWRRIGEEEVLECHGLSAALLTRRLQSILRHQPWVEIHGVRRELCHEGQAVDPKPAASEAREAAQ
jgi:hypothetical protein